MTDKEQRWASEYFVVKNAPPETYIDSSMYRRLSKQLIADGCDRLSIRVIGLRPFFGKHSKFTKEDEVWEFTLGGWRAKVSCNAL